MIRQGQILHGIYEVRNQIGQGSSGQIFLAWHLNLRKYVVIKRIRDDYVGHFNERHEADILKKLHHRYIPQVYDFIQDGADVYTVIDYIQGDTMKSYIDRGVRFSERRIVLWLRQMLDALDYIHSQTPPVIHNDIKPSNILITTEGDLCLIDFNISSDDYSQKDIAGYTKGFASPEQIYRIMKYSTGGNYRDIHLDARSDIFSMAASFYALMTGKNPSEKIRKKLPLWDGNLPYSEQLCNLIGKALEPDPKKRPQSAAEMLGELNSMKRKDREYRKLVRSQSIFTLVMGGIIALGVVLTGFGFYFLTDEQFETDYQTLMAAEEAGNYQEVADQAPDILNDRRYALVLNRNPKDYANLLYITADAWSGMGDYKASLDYYKTAVATGEADADCYRDYAIALVRSGHTDMASDVLAEAEQAGMDDANQMLVEAEIDFSTGDFKAGVEKATDAMNSAGDNDGLVFHAASALADAYEEHDEAQKAADVLKDARAMLDSSYQTSVLRKLSEAYILQIEKQGDASDENVLEEAAACLEQLTDSPGMASLDDYLNLANVEFLQQKYTQAEDLLESIRQDYPDRYEIPALEGLIEISLQNEKSENDRDYSKALDCYQEAKKLHDSARSLNEAYSGQFQQLEDYISELEKAGWIQT